MTRRDFRCQAPITRRLHMSHYARHPTDAWFAACICGWRSTPLDTLDEARNAWTTHAVDTLRSSGL